MVAVLVVDYEDPPPPPQGFTSEWTCAELDCLTISFGFYLAG